MGKINGRTLGIVLLVCLVLMYLPIPLVNEDVLAQIGVLVISLYLIIN